MIPKDFADDNDASIIINFTDANSINHTLNHKLKDSEWTKGRHITYTVTTEDLVGFDYHLEVSGGGITYSGGNITCTVSSYRTLVETSENQNVAWSVTGYSTDGGTTWSENSPNWLTLASASGSGSVSATDVSASVDASSVVTTEQALSTATPKGCSTDYFDLSKHNVRGDETSQNTANCYVVNAPGYYMFPTVYGNAIKNGAANTSAYHTANSGSNILSSFVDHNNATIYTGSDNDPYVQSKYTPDNVILVWQDAENLIEYSTPGELTYDSSTGYIKFHISSANIKQGNAVIALRSGSTILWSWHIWVTPKDIAETIPVTAVNTDYTYRFMSINLGWCGWENTSSYANRYILIKIRQSKSGLTRIIKINQYSDAGLSKTGDNPYYEWGRKDPFLPGTNVNGGNKTYQGNYTWSYGWGQTSISNAIQNPFYKWSVSNGNWCSSYYLNLWDTNNTQISLNYNAVTKTVYDPCPPGFLVPSVAAYSGFVSSSNGNTGVVSNGLFFYTNSTKTNTIFIPGVGYRDSYSYSDRSAGETYQVTTLHGSYNTCTPSSNPYFFNLYYFGATNVNVSAVYGTMAYAFCMRPIEE